MDTQRRKHRVIGIDLGTTYSAVAAFDHFSETAEIIENRLEGTTDQTVASVVSRDRNGKVIVGEAARRNLLDDSANNTVIEIKREMGEPFRRTTPDSAGNVEKYGAQHYYEECLAEARRAAVSLKKNPDEVEVPFRVQFDNDWFLPQEISAFTLMKMKQVAESELGGEIRDAVITVPAYFNDRQRKATEEAALLAGLYPRQLIAEPTAAAWVIRAIRQRFGPTLSIAVCTDHQAIVTGQMRWWSRTGGASQAFHLNSVYAEAYRESAPVHFFYVPGELNAADAPSRWRAVGDPIRWRIANDVVIPSNATMLGTAEPPPRNWWNK